MTAIRETEEALDLSVGEFMRYRNGGNFILDTPAMPEPLWGDGSRVLWADGEALIIVGGQGLGKTTLAQQLALGRCGFEEYGELLGLPVANRNTTQTWGNVLYLAMDRPRQVARSFRRMVGEAWREELNERLYVWEGPPAADIARHPTALRSMAEGCNAETVIVDSLKDAAIGLSDDEVGAGWNRARQLALTAGIQLVELHHNRKAPGGAKGSAPSIDDVYGSTWITSGAGSVVLLAGKPGDPVVEMHHLKQPADEVGPLKILHDHTAGRSSIWEQVDLVGLVSAAPGGLTKQDVARALFETDKPTAAEQEKARRRLQKATEQGLIRCLEEGDVASQKSSRWGGVATSVASFTQASRGSSDHEPLDGFTDSMERA